MNRRLLRLVSFAIAALPMACSRPTPTRSDASANVEAAAPSATASAAPPAASGTAAPDAAPSALAGLWSGAYEATRAAIVLPKKNPWPAWKEDSGRQLGKGSVDLEIDASGNVRGRATGALGALVLSGRVEEGRLRASAVPENADAVGAMAGTLVGEAQGADLHVTLRSSDEKGESVRVAQAVLKRK